VTAPAKPFVHRRRVEFAETDMAGQVHFTQFFRYMEEAEHALWRAAGMSITGMGYGFPRVAATFDFHSPLRFEDEVEVAIQIAAVTRSTIRYACIINKGETKVATGSMTIACVERRPGDAMKAVEIPPEIIARLRT
jgi:YbgC/YbaW family acyl-CoA thioester hydrolase